MSTTGFAAGAAEFAESKGIELREVEKLAPESFADWLVMRDMTSITRRTWLHHATVLIDEKETKERREELKRIISTYTDDVPLLRSTSTGELVPLKNAFLGAVNKEGSLYDDIEPNEQGKKVKLSVNYEYDDDHFVVDTDLGEIRVKSIIFYGELSMEQRSIPLKVTSEYRHSKDGGVISQIAGFEAYEMHGHEFSLEVHKLEETGETHLLLRKVK